MFFIAITRGIPTESVGSVAAEEIKSDSVTFSILTDGFLSKRIPLENGFAVIESPLTNASRYPDILFSEFTYSSRSGYVDISKSTISGRPIYYCLDPNGVFFCSTHIRLLREAGVIIEENTKALPEFFMYRYVIPPQTLYKNIMQVPAGGRLRIKLASTFEIRLCERFTPAVPKESERFSSIDTVATGILDLMRGTCEKLKPANQTVDVLLSGGLDSSILFKIYQDSFDVKKTYSTGYPFEDPENDLEKEYAFSAARAMGVNHDYYRASTEEYLHGILQAVSIAEEPLHHLQSVLLHLLFEKHLPKKKSILVCGMGADGVFGSDLHNRLFRNYSAKDAWWLALFSTPPFINFLAALSRIAGRGKGIIRRLYQNPASRVPLTDVDHVVWLSGKYGDEEWVQNYFHVSREDIILNRYDAIRSYRHRSVSDILSILSFLGSASVTENIWTKLAEAQKKVMFYPFTDLDMMHYAFSVPWDVKLSSPKGILRQVARILSIPEHIVSRPKCSFGIGEDKWAEPDSVFEPMIPLMTKVFDEAQIRLLQTPQHHKAMTFWNILNYAIWKRLCVDDEPLEVLDAELTEAITRIQV